MKTKITFASLAAVCWILFATTSRADEARYREAVRIEIEQLRESGRLSIGGVDIAAGELLAEIYERRNFSPTWLRVEQAAELIDVIKATHADGLDPADYHLREVELVYRELQTGRTLTPAERAAVDILLTDSFIRVAYHQRFGKVNPRSLDTVWNFRRELDDRDPAQVLQEGIESESLTAFLAEHFPRGSLYRQIQVALAEHHEMATAGGWPTIADGAVLRPGASDERVPVMAERLTLSGDLAESPVGSGTTYDETLEAGVRRFQARHGLNADGVIGPATRAALNVPVEERIMQLRLSLERARWVAQDLSDNFIIVNIAGFRAYLVRNHERVWEARVQVGKTYHQTPVFRDEMEYVVFNPTWTVPYSIATKEILPRIKSDPDYLKTRELDAKDRSGNIQDAMSVDWSNVTRENFGYTLIQRAGPGNALGRVKFIFPNEHAVYLHDTPSKSLFEKAERAFSHGCIRVDNPYDLAEILLAPDGWDRERMLALTDTTTVFLSKPLPVLLLYWTADVDLDGTVHFYNDVYERDQKVAQALDARFTMELPEAYSQWSPARVERGKDSG